MSSISIDNTQQRRAFAHWLRTGQRPSTSNTGIELKFNPWHDPDDGRFTNAGAGRYFGRGGAQSTDRRANRTRKVTADSSRTAPSSSPVKKVAEFADGVRQGVRDVGKETVAGLYEIATTNPATTVRNFGESVAKTIDAAVTAEDTPARTQIRRAADAAANASAQDLGYATGRFIGNAGLPFQAPPRPELLPFAACAPFGRANHFMRQALRGGRKISCNAVEKQRSDIMTQRRVRARVTLQR